MENSKIAMQALGIAAGYAILILILKQVRSTPTHHNFVDDDMAQADGGKPKSRTFKPNTWVKVGENWIWVNEKGNLTING